MNTWRLKVENFGKITKADIEVSPFTLFVGDNNSGKSYLMSLIYGIMQLDFGFGEYKINKKAKAYNEIIHFFESILSQEYQKKLNLQKEMYDNFINILNDILKNNKKKLIESIFNVNIELNKIEVEFPYNGDIYIEKVMEKDKLTEILENKNNTHLVIFSVEDSQKKLKGRIGLPEQFLNMPEISIPLIIEFIVRMNCFESGILKSYYLPTSRTGFLLTYKTLVEKSIGDKFNFGKMNKNLLTRPCSEFLSRLASISQENESEKYKEVITYIEKYIIDGKIKVDKIPTSNFSYIPNGVQEELPMFISSGVITEMTPLLLMLKYKDDIGALMMEEPEMCLHPRLQWLITRALIQIANTDTPVIITTHSDTILQHINNMIKLGMNSNKQELMKKYGYSDKDIITKEKIKMYQFDTKEHKTEIKELNCDQYYGFEAPTFNNMLMSLSKQCTEFEEE